MSKLKSILFSVIIPVYNRADCIVRCISSVSEQIFDSFEIIVVNDGSTDLTMQKIESLRSSFEKLKIISYMTNKGVNYARNRGIEKSEGEFIIFLDSDDQLSIGALDFIKNTINKNPTNDHFLFSVSDRPKDGLYINERQEYTYHNWLLGEVSGDFLHVIRREVLILNIFDEKYKACVRHIWLRLFKITKTQLFVNKTLDIRDRDRNDSLWYHHLLLNQKRIETAFYANHILIREFGKDISDYDIHMLKMLIRKNILLGASIKRKENNQYYTDLLKDLGYSSYILLFVNPFVAKIIYLFIISKSNIKYYLKKYL